MRVLMVIKAGLSADRLFVVGSRVTAPDDLDPPTGLGWLGVGLGSSLGVGWSGSTCKIAIDDTLPAESCVQGAAAHSGHPYLPRSRGRKPKTARPRCFSPVDAVTCALTSSCVFSFKVNSIVLLPDGGTFRFSRKQLISGIRILSLYSLYREENIPRNYS